MSVYVKAEKLPPVVFTSHERSKNWIFTSITSILLSSEHYVPEIHVMVGAQNSAYLDNIKHHKNLYVHPLHIATVPGWNRKTGNWKGGWNYLRCLNETTEEGVIIAEDDVIFTNEFWEKFLSIQSHIKSIAGEYVIDLYSRFPGKPVSEKQQTYREKVHSFCCTQCMYYTKGAAQAVYKELQQNLKGVRKWGYDMSVKHLLTQKTLPMYSAYPSLVQHIGVQSSIGSFQFHKSLFFDAGNKVHSYDSKGAIRYSKNATWFLLHRRRE